MFKKYGRQWFENISNKLGVQFFNCFKSNKNMGRYIYQPVCRQVYIIVNYYSIFLRFSHKLLNGVFYTFTIAY